MSTQNLKVVNDKVTCDMCDKMFLYYRAHVVFAREATYAHCPDCHEGMRTCDQCYRRTDAGEAPDWPNGICEYCDPTILHNQ